MNRPATPRSNYLLVAAAVLVVGAFAFAYVRIAELNDRITALSSQLSSTTAALYGTTGTLSADISSLNSATANISLALDSTAQNVQQVSSNVDAVKSQVGGVEQAVGSISGTVTTLTKLASTDPELLRKYSKVYFLNENYTPAHLSQLPQEEVYSNSRPEQYLSEAYPYLQNLLAAAKASGITLYIKSGYRSFGTQEALKSEYRVLYGAGTANAFSADQGYSEHQLGTTVDFITSGLGGQLTESFDTTAAYAWLAANAYKYGFEMSYPKGNSYYVYEPWHWRFVGVKLATYLHDTGKSFYDLDQREIDTYLADLF